MRVDLVYDSDCPNVAEARAELVHAFVEARIAPSWHEHCRADREASATFDGYGSPAILVDGRDVTGELPSGGRACRVYAGGRRAPPRASIVAAIQDATPRAAMSAAATPAGPGLLKPPRPAWLRVAAALPGFAVALLPKVACPACWPLYAGVLGSIGLGFLVRTEILLPVTIVFLAATLASFAVGARRRRGYGPVVLGACAAIGLLIGKFALEIDLAMHASVALLVLASFWNAWPRRAEAKPCAACVPSTPSTEGAST